MSIAIGTLSSEDQRALEDLNLLPVEFDDNTLDANIFHSSAVTPSFGTTSLAETSLSSMPESISRSFWRGTAGGIPWFEEMVEGSHLGRLMRAKRGLGVSGDNSTLFEWEISEWHNDETGRTVEEDSEGNGIGKRKRASQAPMESPQKRA